MNNRCTRLVPQRQCFAIIHGLEPFLWDTQEIYEHSLPSGGCDDLSILVLLKDVRDRSGVILFGMVCDDVVDVLDTLQLKQENIRRARINSIQQSSFHTALNQIGVVTRPATLGYNWALL